jgi:cytochrome c biogenesis protein CcmG/thiol:disulfide interchange protein DsbE
MTRPLVFALALALATPAAAQQDSTSGACDASLGPANLDLTLKDLQGRDVSLRDYRGKVLLINYWATWCIPCKVEIPGFLDLYQRFGDRGLEVVGIGVDEPASTMAPYAAQMKIGYPLLVGRDRKDALEAFGPLVGVPTTVVVGRDGNLCQRYVGFTRKATFENLLQRLLD